MKAKHIILASIFSLGAWSLTAQENICIFNQDNLMYSGSTEEIDRVALSCELTMESGKTIGLS